MKPPLGQKGSDGLQRQIHSRLAFPLQDTRSVGTALSRRLGPVSVMGEDASSSHKVEKEEACKLLASLMASGSRWEIH